MIPCIMYQASTKGGTKTNPGGGKWYQGTYKSVPRQAKPAGVNSYIGCRHTRTSGYISSVTTQNQEK